MLIDSATGRRRVNYLHTESIMPSVGERLRRARKDANLTLYQIAADTKIQHWILDAIERDDMSKVPGGVFIRGYLSSFAVAVGLDRDEILSAYFGTTPAPAPVSPGLPRQSAQREGVPAADVMTKRSTTPPWQIAAIVAALVVAAVVWRTIPRSNPDAAPRPAPEPQESARPVVPAVALTSGPAAEALTAVDASGRHRAAPAAAALVLQVHPTADVWLEATADGRQQAYRMFGANDDLRIEAQREVVLRVGDASAVTYTINGAPGRALGGAGRVRELVITPDNYATLVGPAAPATLH